MSGCRFFPLCDMSDERCEASAQCALYEPMPEIVRCRDCSMYDAEDGMCMRDPDHTGRGWFAAPDGFCAWGMARKRGDRK